MYKRFLTFIFCRKENNICTSQKKENKEHKSKNTQSPLFTRAILKDECRLKEIRSGILFHSQYLISLKHFFDIQELQKFEYTPTHTFIVPYPEFAILLGKYDYLVSILTSAEDDLMKSSEQSKQFSKLENYIYHADIMQKKISNGRDSCRITIERFDVDSVYKEYREYFSSRVILLGADFYDDIPQTLALR